MAELLRFSRSDIEDLVSRLRTFSSGLPEPEQRLLLAILSVAADHAFQPAEIPAGATLAELHEQIIRSFVPGSSKEFEIRPPGRIGEVR